MALLQNLSGKIDKFTNIARGNASADKIESIKAVVSEADRAHQNEFYARGMESSRHNPASHMDADKAYDIGAYAETMVEHLGAVRSEVRGAGILPAETALEVLQLYSDMSSAMNGVASRTHPDIYARAMELSKVEFDGIEAKGISELVRRVDRHQLEAFADGIGRLKMLDDNFEQSLIKTANERFEAEKSAIHLEQFTQ